MDEQETSTQETTATPTQEATTTTETPDNDSAAETEKPAYNGKSYRAHPGYSPVDLDSLPDDIREPIKNRFDYFYRQINDQKRVLGDYRDIAKTQSQKIEDLMSGVGHVVNHLQTKTFADTETALRAEARKAYETGDLDAYQSAQDKLIDLQVDKKLAAKKAPVEQEIKQRDPLPTSGSDVGRRAMENGEINSDDLRVIEAWQSEGEGGIHLRPWAINRSNDPNNPDPEYLQALQESAAVFTNKRFANMTTEQKLMEVDKRMGVIKRPASQNVMGGNLTGNRKNGKVSLSPKMQQIAIRTKFGGPKAKSDADHIEAYRKQLEKVQSANKGTRQ